MKSFEYSDKELLNAFMKTAQYLARLTAREDVRHRIARLIVKFYRADSAGFARRREDGEIETLHLVTSNGPNLLVSSKQVRECFYEVFETGFLAWRSFGTGEEPYTVIFLPVDIGNETAEVMLVGHAATGPVAKEVLKRLCFNIAGLAGATITRLISETELKNHRAHLEKLVSAAQANSPAPSTAWNRRLPGTWGPKKVENNPGPPRGAG